LKKQLDKHILHGIVVALTGKTGNNASPGKKRKKGKENSMSEVKKNTVVVDPDYPGSRNTCNVREYTPDDASALAAGRISAHELPLSGEWQAQTAYEWGDQRVACYARWNKATSRVQVVKAHGNDEDLYLDPLGNLWELRWNSASGRWDKRLVG